jgi:hypothetical protein
VEWRAGWCRFAICETIDVAVTVIVQDDAAFGDSAPILLGLEGIASPQ